MGAFIEFIDKKTREAKHQLSLLEKVLTHGNMKVENFLKEDDPYIFLHAPQSDVSFDGIRIYKIGDRIAFRVQKQNNTHPYGRAYSLDLDEMFNDYMSDGGKPEEAGKKVLKAVVSEIKRFFKSSASAEEDLKNNDDKEMMGFKAQKGSDKQYQSMNGPADFASLIYSKF